MLNPGTPIAIGTSLNVRFSGAKYRVYDTTRSDPVASYYKPFDIMLEIGNSRVWGTDGDDSVVIVENHLHIT